MKRTHKLTVGSLFSGIGGIELGLQRTSHFEIAWQVEIDPWCRKLLTQHWPEVPKFGDIKLCGAHNLECVDLIVGGFPCQDISTAGKQAGIEEGERSGLWREQARIIAELRPRYVIIENVAALLYATKRPDGTRRPAAIQRVLHNLAASGYDAQWRVCSAAEFGAPHLRKRVFIVAYLPGERGRAWRAGPARLSGQANAHSSSTEDVEHTAGARCEKREYPTGTHPESDTSGDGDRGADAALADADGDRRGQWTHKPEPGTKRDGTPYAGEDGKYRHVADSGDIYRGTGHNVPDRSNPGWQEAAGELTTLCKDSKCRHVADATSTRCPTGRHPGRTEPSGESFIHDAQHSGKVLAYPYGAGLQEWQRHGPAPSRIPATADECCAGQAESLLGRGAYGVSRELDEAFLSINAIFEELPPGLDQISHQWPAGPGQEQYTWEPPRVIEGKLPDRVARLKGLGNAALPQIAEAIGRGIQRHNAQQQRLEVDGC